MSKRSNFGGKECNGRSLFVSKRDVDGLVRALDGVVWCDEDSVWDFGVLLGEWSVRLRGEVLRRSEEE